MKDKIKLSTELCALTHSDADKLLELKDGDCALVYIRLLRHGSQPPNILAEALGMSAARFHAALAKLSDAKLIDGRVRHVPSDEIPHYDAEDIEKRSDTDLMFQHLVRETERLLGRALSGNDLRTLFGIYDYLGMTAELIILLINHCVDEARARYGAGRNPNMRAIEREAYFWANSEIMSLEAAEDFIKRAEQRRDRISTLKNSFGIRDRDLTATEQKHLSTWLDMGFGVEALEIAYDRTVTNTGSLRWPYMNKIVQSWHKKGLHSAEDIEKGDGTKRRPPIQGDAQAETSDVGLEGLMKIYDMVKDGKG